MEIWGQKLALLAYLEAIKVDYTMIIKKNWILKDEYTGMMTTTYMYTMCKMALMDEFEKLWNSYE